MPNRPSDSEIMAARGMVEISRRIDMQLPPGTDRLAATPLSSERTVTLKGETATAFMEKIAREGNTVKGIEKTGTAVERLYNEYGTPLAPDEQSRVIKRILEAKSQIAVDRYDHERRVYDDVKKGIAEYKESEKYQLKQWRDRRFRWAIRTLVATVAMQAGGVMATIWCGDWRWTLSAIPFVAVDIGAVVFADANNTAERSRW